MSRKTFDVEEFKDKVNGMLVNSLDDFQDGRIAMITLVENVLMESGNYGGFRYLDANEMKDSDGTTVGINEVDGEILPMDERFEGTDYTRVKYF